MDNVHGHGSNNKEVHKSRSDRQLEFTFTSVHGDASVFCCGGTQQLTQNRVDFISKTCLH